MALLKTYYNNMERVRALYPNTLFISVSRSLSKDKDKNPYNPCGERDLILAPSIQLWKDYKTKKISWPEYILEFKDEMSNDWAQGSMWVLAQRADAKDVCLVCFEGPEDGERCHRFLPLGMVNNIAKNNGINIQVIKTINTQPAKFSKTKKKAASIFKF